MAKPTFAASLAAFADLSKQNIRYILNEAIGDVIEGAMTPQDPVRVTGGSFETGKIPVDSKELISSLKLNDQPISSKDGLDAEAVTLEPGGVDTFAWTAPHSARIEFGFVGEDSLGRQYEQAGRFFVSEHAVKFGEYVEKHAKEVSGK